jgi:hypothetical protein
VNARRFRNATVVGVALLAVVAGCGDGDGSRPAAPAPVVAPIAFAAPEPVVVDDVDDFEPRIAADGDGAWLAVWSRASFVDGVLTYDVVAARSAGGARWDAAVLVSGGINGMSPRVAGDGHGSFVVVWEDRPGGDVFAARSSDGGRAWSAPVPLTAPGARSNLGEVPGDFEVATDRRGTWVIGFTLDTPLGNPLVMTSVSRDGGASWGASVTLHSGSAFDFQPLIAADGRGAWVVVWGSDDALVNPSRDINGVGLLTVRSLDDGRTWSAPSPVVAVTDELRIRDEAPHLATDGTGTWHVVWAATREEPDVGGFHIEIQAVRSTDDGATWTPPRTLNDPAFATANLRPRIGADAVGRVVTFWSTLFAANRSEILFVQSTDRGGTWTDPAPFPGGEVNYPRDGFVIAGVATDDRGSWRVAWSRSNADTGPIEAPFHDVVVAAGTAAVDQSSGLAGRLVSPIR